LPTKTLARTWVIIYQPFAETCQVFQAGWIEVKILVYVNQTIGVKMNITDLNNLVTGWQFSIHEISYGAYRVVGVNKWGNSVSRTCSDSELDETLQLCANDAHEIDNQLRDKNL
jgi:hypothetical protein